MVLKRFSNTDVLCLELICNLKLAGHGEGISQIGKTIFSQCKNLLRFVSLASYTLKMHMNESYYLDLRSVNIQVVGRLLDRIRDNFTKH